jgi:hypothetical protein
MCQMTVLRFSCGHEADEPMPKTRRICEDMLSQFPRTSFDFCIQRCYDVEEEYEEVDYKCMKCVMGRAIRWCEKRGVKWRPIEEISRHDAIVERMERERKERRDRREWERWKHVLGARDGGCEESDEDEEMGGGEEEDDEEDEDERPRKRVKVEGDDDEEEAEEEENDSEENQHTNIHQSSQPENEDVEMQDLVGGFPAEEVSQGEDGYEAGDEEAGDNDDEEIDVDGDEDEGEDQEEEVEEEEVEEEEVEEEDDVVADPDYVPSDDDEMNL